MLRLVPRQGGRDGDLHHEGNGCPHGTEEYLIDDLISPRRRPEQDAATVIGQIRREVLHKHKLDICIRDLKLDNSLFSEKPAYRAQRLEAHRLRPVSPTRAGGGPHRGRQHDELRDVSGTRLELRGAMRPLHLWHHHKVCHGIHGGILGSLDRATDLLG